MNTVLGWGRDEQPTVRPVPEDATGFRVRLHLQGTEPEVWRRLDLPGDLTLDRLHDAIQAAMGWTDSHLHHFRTGADPRSPYFITAIDVELEGSEGVLETDVRLDQVVSAVGDVLGYDYDFGDDWDHLLEVEAVLDDPPSSVRCVDGRQACPPEDCGGIGGHHELAEWVRSGHDPALLPDAFDDSEHARDWLPVGWHPDHFDLDEANAALAAALADPLRVHPDLADLVAHLEQFGNYALRHPLLHPALRGPVEVSDADAARMTEPYRILLEAVGTGVELTAAGYLRPQLVQELAERMGVTSWWIGRASREDQTPPVAVVRDTARSLGLVAVRKGRLTPTAAARKVGSEPQALLAHIVGRLPIRSANFDRHAGWVALLVVGSDAPRQTWERSIHELLEVMGWQRDQAGWWASLAPSPTLDTLRTLAGQPRLGWEPEGVIPPVAAVARAAVRRA